MAADCLSIPRLLNGALPLDHTGGHLSPRLPPWVIASQMKIAGAATTAYQNSVKSRQQTVVSRVSSYWPDNYQSSHTLLPLHTLHHIMPGLTGAFSDRLASTCEQ